MGIQSVTLLSAESIADILRDHLFIADYDAEAFIDGFDDAAKAIIEAMEIQED